MTIRKRIDKSAIWVWIVFLGVFRPSIIPGALKIAFRALLLGIGLVYIVLQLKPKKLFNITLLYSVAVILSCVLNFSQDRLTRANLLNGIQYALCIYELYTIMEVYITKRKEQVLMRSLCSISGIYCLLSILLIFLFRKSEIYFLGSKYKTAYMMMFYLGIKYYINEKQIRNNPLQKYLYVCIIVLFEAVIWYIKCMTGFISIFVMLVLVLFSNSKVKQILSQPMTLICLMLLSMLVMFVITRILEFTFVQNIIVNVLHKNLTLTDRLNYYKKAMDVFLQGNIYYGYGYASDEMRDAIARGTNIQNGLFQQLLYYGIIGTASIILIVYYSAFYGHMNTIKNWPFVVVIIGFIIAAIAEISYSTIFFMSVFALRWFGYERKDIFENYIHEISVQ